MAHRFVIYMACAVEGELLNTAVDFVLCPRTLSEMVRVGEALYGPERHLRLRGTGGPSSPNDFIVVACMIFNQTAGQWEELVAAESLFDGCQIFLFDSTNSDLSQGQLPKVRVVVNSRTVLEAAAAGTGREPASHSEDHGHNDSSSASSAQRKDAGASWQGSSNKFSARDTVRRFGPPSAVDSHRPPLASASHSAEASHSGFQQRAPSTQTKLLLDPSATRRKPFQILGNQTQLSAQSLRFLFDQLRKAATGDSGTPSSTSSIPTQLFHKVCVENGLLVSTEDFADIVRGRVELDYHAWHDVAQSFGPLVDALYLRLAERTALRREMERDGSLTRDAPAIQRELDELEDEEIALNARLSALQARRAELNRAMREEQYRASLLEPNGTEEQQKEWEMVGRFVSLRLRQLRLKEEEALVTHQLSLLS